MHVTHYRVLRDGRTFHVEVTYPEDDPSRFRVVMTELRCPFMAWLFSTLLRAKRRRNVPDALAPGTGGAEGAPTPITTPGIYARGGKRDEEEDTEAKG